LLSRRRAVTAGAAGTSGQKATYELRPVSGISAQGFDADALKAHLVKRVEVVVRPVELPAPPKARDRQLFVAERSNHPTTASA
jgi:hypothetical protein